MTTTPEQTERLRRMFKLLNPVMVWQWRLGLGKLMNMGPERLSGRYMVLTHIGRKSGDRHLTPINFALHEGDIYCMAGFGEISDWYRNIKANPHVEVWLPDGWWAGVAEEVPQSDERWLPLLRRVLIASGFAARLFGVDPDQLDDEALRAAASDYRVVRIRRTEARTGPYGPGEYAWVWPLATFLLLFRPRRRRKK